MIRSAWKYALYSLWLVILSAWTAHADITLTDSNMESKNLIGTKKI